MSTAAFTPGPWEWCGNNLDSGRYDEVIKAEVSCGTYCYGGSVSMTICDADRLLIAAAPDLLAALKACLWCMESDLPPEVTEAERLAAAAAIALATGAPA